ncbi:phospholipase C, phosphocholine-specific [Pedobacter sp. MC2016-15]|uniref:phosphocholine-specific phospholipase C n=1 Tax=Pedobacter sp. MC2016-15 TaxID=2994473 RepID=UPI002245C820|nr:phospholipase C, phosphocholine-specific [Pedobacter sp. MC2016-15]MCX2481114.1 phospholipase C, phosphocholine-specific [Pedobacter sp. MC2016-15]
MDNRREFIKKAALLSGAAGLYSVLPSSILKAMSIDPKAGSTYMDAEHVVILMQENRSFDHCFGSLKGVRGFNDPRAIDLPNKNKVWMQSNAAGETYAPFRLNLKDSKSTWMNSLPHSWSNQVNARNDGKYDQWLNVKQSGNPAYAKMPLTLGYHTREDIPFYYAMADAFTVCDQNFCSALTGTTPNRLYLWSGTIREQQNENSRAHVWNEDADFGTLHWKTFPERLEENGVSWKCYQNELSINVGFKGEEESWLSNYTDNPLEFFAQYHVQLHPKHLEQLKKRLPLLQEEITALKTQIAGLAAGDALKEKLTKQLNEKTLAYQNNEKLLQPGQFEQLPKQEQNIHLKGFDTNKNDPDYHSVTDLTYDDNGEQRTMKVPKGDVLYQFREDVQKGKLPAVSWITAPENFSDHPGAPWYGAWYLSEVMDILTKNPEVWKKTIFILTYDENDGYFDHIPPFVAPHSHKEGTGKVSAGIDTRVEYVTLEQEQDRHDFPQKFDRECAIGLGFRVPMIIASPWSRGGYVNSEVFDHTSTLQFLEKWLSKKTGKKIEEPNISEWRRTVCGDLTSVFRADNNDKITYPKPVVKEEFLESIHKAKFKQLPEGFKLLTTEEIAQINLNPEDSAVMPKQEKGIRPSCALPYQLYADGMLSADKKSFDITFDNQNVVFGAGTAGAPFNVYAPGKYRSLDHPDVMDDLRTWAYGLKAGDQLSDSWPLADFDGGLYHLRVYGPNGFYREFTGDKNDPAVQVSVVYQQEQGNKGGLTGNLELKINNTASEAQTVEITDHSYKINNHHKIAKASQVTTQVLNLSGSHGWYDFSVRINGNPNFTKRYAGRVETGKSSFSDPFMGRVVV